VNPAEDKNAKLAEWYHDPVLAACDIVPHWFPGTKQEGGSKSPRVDALHRGVLAILLRKCNFLMKYGDRQWIEDNFVYTDPDGNERKIFDLTSPAAPRMEIAQFTLIMMPRGFSKTTCNNFANLFNIIFQEIEFSAYVGETSTHADRQVANIKNELETNTVIREYFGSLKPPQRGTQKWTEDFFETITGMAMIARGSGTQIRGLLHKGRRPKRFLLDDLETKESVKTEQQRADKKEWYYGDVEPALDELDEESSITATGTLLHEDALLANLMLDPRWTVVKFGALDKDGAPVWHRKGHDWFNRKKAAFTRAGVLHIFYLEYMNEIRTPEHQDFEQRMMNILPRPMGEMVARAIAIDPAISEAESADYCGICVMGMTEKGFLHVFDILLQRGMSPREQVDEYFARAMKYECNSDMHGVESIAYQAALVHLLQEEMARKRWFFTPVKITHKDLSHEQRNKIARIRGILQPRYSNGYVTHQMHFPTYEGQLLDFPRGKKDGPDVASMCVTLLDPVAGAAAPEDSFEDEYEPLEEIFGGDWRDF
jgi:hypothetical protein